MSRFFENEVPVKVITDNGEFRYYPKAKLFQLSKPKWKTLDGETRMGKTVTTDLKPFIGNQELIALLNQVVATLAEQDRN